MKPLISLSEWMKWYRTIIDTMGFDPEKDKYATVILASILKDNPPSLNYVEALVKNKNVVIFGAGPSLPQHIEELLEKRVLTIKHVVLVAADGASRALLEHGITPHIIVSDLDGGDDVLIDAASKGAYVFAHGHGDNIDKIESIVPEMKRITRRVIGTTQVEPIYPVLNFGGFTDGDRAVFITASMSPRMIVLAGMDLGNIVGKYSKPWLRDNVPANTMKKKKLEIAYNLLSYASSRYPRIYSLSRNTPVGIKHVGSSELVKLIRTSQ
ncbi:DUF115 domain-containing protein [Desulfurococcaceae archaeon MEX13E-LK6-19]|nr:DUF115 domain-containing protein [Desulfurococcaceae archaeon MEX13E-LK6-19]